MNTSKQTIEDIKSAVDLGFKVTLAKSAAYEVIKDSIGQYLIAFDYKQPGQNFIGLHGVIGTKYEHRINMAGDWIVSGTIKGGK